MPLVKKIKILFLLLFFDVAYLGICNSVNGDVGLCVLHAAIITFSVLFFIVTTDVVLHMLEGFLDTSKDEEICKSIKEEYKKIYKIRKQHNLLEKAGCGLARRSKVIYPDVFGLDNFSLNKTDKKAVHFNYYKSSTINSK